METVTGQEKDTLSKSKTEEVMQNKEFVSEDQKRARIIHDEERWLSESRKGRRVNRLGRRGKGRELELMVGYFNP